MFINELIKLIKPQISPDITQLNSVFFADDSDLLADTPAGLQRLLNALIE